MFAGDQNGLQADPRLKAISEAIRVVPHFPKPGFFFLSFSEKLLSFSLFLLLLIVSKILKQVFL